FSTSTLLGTGTHNITAAYTSSTNPNYNTSGLSNQVTVTINPVPLIVPTEPITVAAFHQFTTTISFRNTVTGLVDPNFNSQVTVSLASGPGTLGGTTTVTAVAGVATFTDLTLSAAGTYTLQASLPGLPTLGLPPTPYAPFTIKATADALVSTLDASVVAQ